MRCVSSSSPEESIQGATKTTSALLLVSFDFERFWGSERESTL